MRYLSSLRSISKFSNTSQVIYACAGMHTSLIIPAFEELNVCKYTYLNISQTLLCVISAEKIIHPIIESFC